MMPKSRRRWLRWIALGWLIVLGLAGGRWWYQERTAARGREELAAAIAETDRLDPRWHWEEIEADRPAVADAENSMRMMRELGDLLADWHPLTQEFPDGEGLWAEGPANRELDEDRLAFIGKTLKKRERSLVLARSLKDYPHGRAVINLPPDYVSARLPQIQDCRLTFTLLEMDIEWELHEGRPKDAAGCIPTILKAAAGLRDEPSLVSQSVRMRGRTAAVRRLEHLLGMGELGDDELKRLMAAFKAEQDQNLLLTGIRGERAGLHVLFENLEAGQLSPSDLFAVVGMPINNTDLRVRFADFSYKPRVYEDHSFMLRRMNEACAIAQLPTHEQMAAWREWGHRFRTARAENFEQTRFMLTFLLTPALDRVGEAAVRDQAHLSCVLTVLAAERFRLAHQRWPNNLQELCPKYLAEVPIDPFDGKPLCLARKKDGIAIYSVGKDGQDDGGEILNPGINDSGKADLGLRLWDPKQRRLPAEPRKKDDEKEPDNEK